MASAEQQLLSEHEDVYNKFEDDRSITSDVQVDDSQFQQLTKDEDGLSQLSDEEAVSETQFNNDEPGLIMSDEGIDVASGDIVLSQEPPVDTIMEQEPVEDADVNFVKRPESAGQVTPQEGFTFGKRQQQHMDFTGTRKGPASNTVAGTEVNSKEVTVARDAELSPAVESQAPKKTRKAKKPRRYNTAPEEPVLGYDASTLTDDSTVQEYHKSSEPIEEPPASSDPGEQYYEQPRVVDRAAVAEEEQIDLVSPRSQRLSSEHDHREDGPSARDTCSQPDFEQEPTQSEHAATHHSSPDGPEYSRNQRPRSQHTPQGNHNVDLRQISSRHCSPKVSKSRKKQSRRATAPPAAETAATGDSLTDVNDYLQIAWLKVTQLKSYYETQYKEKVGSLESEQEKRLQYQSNLEEELEHTTHEKETQAAVIQKQHTELAKYKTKLKELKNWSNGIAKDIDDLKKDANAHRERHDKLVQEAKAHQAEREAVLRELNLCTEANTTLRKKTLAELAESEQRLRDANVKSKYLEQQLDQTVGMLAEERDRRSRLDSQLDQLRGPGAQAHARMIELIEASKQAMLEKLSEIYEALRGDHETDGLSYMSMETLTAVQALSTQSHTSGEEIASTKTAIAKLNESVAEYFQASKTASDKANGSTFQSWLDQALSTLKGELQHHEERVQQYAAQQEHKKTLQEKVKRSNERVSEANAEISSVKEREQQLAEDNAKLQARILALQNNASSAGDSATQSDEVKFALEDKTRALEAARSDSSKKAAEISSLKSTHVNLQKQIQTLETQVEELENAAANFSSEKEEFHRNATAENERVRKETAEHAEIFVAETKSQSANELKRLTSERNRLEKQLKTVSEELAACKARIESMERDPRRCATGKDQEVEKLHTLNQSQKQELETLHSALTDLQTSAKGTASLKKEIDSLNAQCEDQRKEALQAKEEKLALVKEAEASRSKADAAELAREQANSELTRHREELEETIEALQKDLNERKELNERSTAGYARLKKSCDDAVLEEKNRSERHIKDLQDRLAEAQSEVQQAKESDLQFRQEIEQSWQSNVQVHEKEVSNLEDQVAQLESQKNEATQENERLRQKQQKTMDEQLQTLTEQLNDALKRAGAAEAKVQPQEQHSDATSNSASRIFVPRIGDNVTPAAGLHSSAPSKSRKKVDRNSNTTIEDALVPAPQELRDSPKNDIVNSNAPRAPVVEDSQQVGSICSDDMFTGVGSGSQQLPEVVPETQSQDGLPSFAAFNSNGGTASFLQRPKAPPMESSLPVLQDSQPGNNGPIFVEGHKHYNNSRSMHESSFTFASRPQDSFTIFDDAQAGDGFSQLEESKENNEPRSGKSLYQVETDEFTYRKPVAHPNSSSKRVYGDVGISSTGRQGSDTSRRSAEHDRTSNGSMRGAGTKGPLVKHMNNAADTRSSTPEWMHKSTTKRKNSYGTPGNSGGKRRSSKTTSGLIADPRLENRKQPETQKRKALGQIIAGYEPERKKRLSSESTLPVEQSRHFSSQPSSQPYGASRFPNALPTPNSAQPQRSGQRASTRMQTLGGGSSRAKRGVRNPSKNSEAEARFMHELRSR